METTLKEFLIEAKYKNQFEDKIHKLNMKAIKCNLPQYSYNYSQAIEKDNKVFIPISIVGINNIKIDGWEFIASIKHVENDYLIFSSSDINVPKDFTYSGCEHCNVNRKRNNTYILHKDGKYMQVGSTCIKDFFNGSAPENIMKFSDLVSELRTYIKNINSIDSSSSTFLLKKYLSMTSATIRDYGWVSKSKNNSDYTAARVFSYMKDMDNAPTITEFDEIKANEVMSWISKLNEKDLENSYLHNLKVIFDYGFVDEKTFAIAASMIFAYNNSKPKEKESEYFGNVGDKVILDLIFKRSFEFFTIYGTKYIHSFNDEDDNIFIWSTTKYYDFEQNKKYLIKGTIKEHKLYKEKYKQTELTRCKIESN